MIERVIQSPEGGDQRLFICETPIHEEDMHVTVHGLEDIEAIKVANKEKYGALPKGTLEIPTWNAPTLQVRFRDVPSDLSKLELDVSSALHAQAIRRHVGLADALPVTVIGVIEVKDGYVLAGVRRGAVQGQKISLLPLGYEDAERYKAPLEPDELPHTPFEQLYQEGLEEAGYGRFELAHARLIGAQVDHFTSGLNLVFYANLNFDKAHVLQHHGASLAIYQDAQRRALSSGEPSHKARKVGHAAVEEFSKPLAIGLPVDAGDHYPLVFLSPTDISDALARDCVDVVNVLSGAKEAYPLMSPTKGALFMYDLCKKEGILRND